MGIEDCIFFFFFSPTELVGKTRFLGYMHYYEGISSPKVVNVLNTDYPGIGKWHAPRKNMYSHCGFHHLSSPLNPTDPLQNALLLIIQPFTRYSLTALGKDLMATLVLIPRI